MNSKADTNETNACSEFLNAERKMDFNFDGGFYTRNFVKPTAIVITFLNGKSFYPEHIFKSIVFSKSICLRRLNKSNLKDCLRKNVSNLILTPILLKELFQ